MEKKYVAFKNVEFDVLDEYKVLNNLEEANAFLESVGDEWDIVDLDTFKVWHPHLFK